MNGRLWYLNLSLNATQRFKKLFQFNRWTDKLILISKNLWDCNTYILLVDGDCVFGLLSFLLIDLSRTLLPNIDCWNPAVWQRKAYTVTLDISAPLSQEELQTDHDQLSWSQKRYWKLLFPFDTLFGISKQRKRSSVNDYNDSSILEGKLFMRFNSM